MYKVKTTNQYKKDLKRVADNRNLVVEIENVVKLLANNDIPLPQKFRDHSLKGQFAEFRECHIRPDWLLVYKKDKNELVLLLIRTGTHAHIF